MDQNKSVFILKNRLGVCGGLEKYSWRIAKAFSRKGCRVTFLTGDSHYSSEEIPLLDFKHLDVSTSPFSYKRILSFDKACQKYLSNHFPNIVFGMDRTTCQTHIRAGNGVHRAFLEKRKLIDSSFKKLITPINPLHKTILDIEKKAFENPNLQTLFTNSEMVRNEVLKYYNTPAEKIKVIHNGVEWYEMQRTFDSWLEKKSKVAAKLNLDPSVYHFLFIGNGYKRKGLDVLLKALSFIKNENFHLSVLGKEKNLSNYVRLAKSLGLKNKVSFYGQVRDVHKFYQLSDAIVIPSFYDPFANVTVEALSMGLLVISSPYNGGKEVLTTESGIVLPSLNPEDIVPALKKAFESPKTWLRSSNIRSQVKHLDFTHQIGTLVESCLIS